MTGNSGVRLARLDPSIAFLSDLQALDRLPPRLRKALQLSPKDWSARAVLERVRTHGEDDALRGLLAGNDRHCEPNYKATGVAYQDCAKLIGSNS